MRNPSSPPCCLQSLLWTFILWEKFILNFRIFLKVDSTLYNFFALSSLLSYHYLIVHLHCPQSRWTVRPFFWTSSFVGWLQQASPKKREIWKHLEYQMKSNVLHDCLWFGSQYSLFHKGFPEFQSRICIRMAGYISMESLLPAKSTPQIAPTTACILSSFEDTSYSKLNSDT